jgi:hypothetical protein
MTGKIPRISGPEDLGQLLGQVKRCLLCGDPRPVYVGAFVPDPAILPTYTWAPGPPEGCLRVLAYWLCWPCFDQPGIGDLVEERIRRAHAASLS